MATSTPFNHSKDWAAPSNSSSNGSGNSVASNSFSGGQLVGSSYMWGWDLGGNRNSSTGSQNNQVTSLSNVILGNGQWIIGGDNTPDRFSSMVTDFMSRKVDSVIFKLRMRLPLSSAGNPSGDGNPFADGRNPFGEGNMPVLPGLDYLKSVYGENFPIGVVNTDGSAANLDSDSSNPFAQVNYQFAGGMPEQSSFDITKFFLSNTNGTDISFGNGGTAQLPFVLRSIQANISSINSSVKDLFAAGNTTPLQTPSDLLRLFRADMYSFNRGIDIVSNTAASNSSSNSSNPFANLNGGGGSSANATNLFANLFGGGNSMTGGSNNPFGTLLASGQGQIPFDIIQVALKGILPFADSDNVFTTNEGDLPIGYGNNDFGTGNAVLGNANWDYGNSNATIGNGNWHWDYSKNNATIGNGNWHLDSTQNNRTVGNGNWYWDSTSNNATLGNGNWHFGDNNTTLGNGNWSFGSNNTIIGNGNRVFTNNSIVIGNGNWSVVIDKSTSGADSLLNSETLRLVMGVKDGIDNLVDSIIGEMSQAFKPLTGEFGEASLQTYNRLFLS